MLFTFYVTLYANVETNPYLLHNTTNIDSSAKEFLGMIYSEKDIAMKNKKAKQEELLKKLKLERIEREKRLRLLRIELAKKEINEKIYRVEDISKKIALLEEAEKERKILEAKKLALFKIAEKKRKALEAKKQKAYIESRSIFVKIDVSKQQMKVYKGKKHLHTWKVSTGKNGYRTPRGRYKPTLIQKMHYSRKYNNAPMPYTVFFKGGYAVHGTKSVSRLGSRASHGCVRLHTSNAKKFYSLVRKYGKKYTQIKIVN
jgi:lipoprotein-anchoring transpeptidase ErfK/SrfK